MLDERNYYFTALLFFGIWIQKFRNCHWLLFNESAVNKVLTKYYGSCL